MNNSARVDMPENKSTIYNIMVGPKIFKHFFIYASLCDLKVKFYSGRNARVEVRETISQDVEKRPEKLGIHANIEIKNIALFRSAYWHADLLLLSLQ